MSKGKEKGIKVVCFSEIQWKYVRTRKQQILSRFPSDWEVLFLSTFVKGKRNNILPERDGRVMHACVPVFKNFPQKWLKRVFSVPPVRFLWNVMIYLWVNVLFLLTGFARSDRVFYVSNIYYGAVLGLLPRRLMLYDCNDDHLGFPNTPRWAEGYFRRVALNADVVVAVSERLVEKLEKYGVENIHLIGNGVDYELFSRSASEGVPDDVVGLPRPRICYSGAVAPWFDFKLLDAVSERFPDASVVLLGPVFEDSRSRLDELIRKRKNIFHLGAKPYEELGAYLSAMDVCIIPLKMNELMRYADPNKIYEYAAAGRPIVTLEHSKKRGELEGLVYSAASEKEFLLQLSHALRHGVDEEKLKAFARRCSWQARADAMKEVILRNLS